jgi:protein-tyrosine phosphatase
VLIHCKAGRGRAATIALCFLVATTKASGTRAKGQQARAEQVDKIVASTMQLLQSRRPVCEPVILNYAPVQRFTTACIESGTGVRG